MRTRAATTRDIDAVARCIALAFATDPVWEPALRRADGRTDHHEPYWRMFVEAAVDQGSTFMTDAGEAVAVWVPPGGDELTPSGVEALDEFLERNLDPDGVDAMHRLFARFEASRAPLAAHYYLSLLATHPDHRGRGVGQALLAANLAAWDDADVPAYLESTNPANDHRYARAGFRPIGRFETVRDRAWVTAMWRDVGGPGV
ncbi:MAG TPA: GNAT family N-acetyltransferase [Candidatus Limnocylindrales bacterium]|nr:GNAT family N-acetyltransferase [Candidatus Limnocylindrales bacterium]